MSLLLGTSAATYAVHLDPLGSTIEATQEDGARACTQAYAPWGGTEEGSTCGGLSRVLYTGHQFDADTGWTYFGARYYDPEIARFLTSDLYEGDTSIPPSLSKYLYAYASPYRWVDLEGYGVLDKIVGAARNFDWRRVVNWSIQLGNVPSDQDIQRNLAPVREKLKALPSKAADQFQVAVREAQQVPERIDDSLPPCETRLGCAGRTVAKMMFVIPTQISLSPLAVGDQTVDFARDPSLAKFPVLGPAGARFGTAAGQFVVDSNFENLVEFWGATGEVFLVAYGGAKIGSAAYSLANSGAVLDADVTASILETPRGRRPDPSTYMSREHIAYHIEQFNDGVTRFSANSPRGTVGPPGGTFVIPKSVADELILRAGCDIAKLEEMLGLDRGALGRSPVRIDIQNPRGLRMPSGNEYGANEQWRPGGIAGSGIPEAAVDPVPVGSYSVKPVF